MIKKLYTVLTAIHTDRRYEPGEMIDLGEVDAAALIAVRAIDAVAVGEVSGTPPDPDARQAAIVDAIAQLDADNPDVWLRDGKPDAAALAEITGWTVSAAERNAAWASVQTAP